MRSEYEKRTFETVERREFWEKGAGKNCPIMYTSRGAFFFLLSFLGGVFFFFFKNTLYLLRTKRRDKVRWLF